MGYLSSDRSDIDWASIGEAYEKYVEYISIVNAHIR